MRGARRPQLWTRPPPSAGSGRWPLSRTSGPTGLQTAEGGQLQTESTRCLPAGPPAGSLLHRRACLLMTSELCKHLLCAFSPPYSPVGGAGAIIICTTEVQRGPGHLQGDPTPGRPHAGAQCSLGSVQTLLPGKAGHLLLWALVPGGGVGGTRATPRPLFSPQSDDLGAHSSPQRQNLRSPLRSQDLGCIHPVGRRLCPRWAALETQQGGTGQEQERG